MAENEEPMEMEIDNDSLDEKVNKFNQTLASDLLNAPKLFETIVNDANALPNVNLAKVFNAASQLAKSIKRSSNYKQREMAAAVSKLELVAKILIVREFKYSSGVPLLGSNFSVEAALSSPIGYNKCSVYKKVALHKTLAHGDNIHGRLGVEGGEVINLTEIPLPSDLEIIDIYMSHFHTIFVMDNGEVYGVGKAENFLSNGTIGILTVPVKLDYVRIDAERKRPFCRVTDSCTIFLKYRREYDLVVGAHTFRQIKDSGPNWALVLPGRFSDKYTHVELKSWLTDKPRWYNIDSNACWIYTVHKRREIVFIICGRRISTKKFGSNIRFCQNGTVYAHRNGTLYKGQLATAFGSKDGDDKEAGYDEALVALMEEVVLPFYVDGFYVNPSGNSLIFYKKSLETASPLMAKLKKLDNWAPKSQIPKLESIYKLRYPRDLQTTFAAILRTFPEDLARILYSPPPSANQPDQFFTGLPKAGTRFLRILLQLQRFLELGVDTQVPDVLLKLDKFDESDFPENLQKAFENSCDMSRKIRVLIATTEEGEARKTEIIEKAKILIEEVTDNITDSLNCLVNLPLKYRREERDSRFCHAVKLIMDSLELELIEMNRSPIRFTFEKLTTFDFVKKAIEDRLKYRDVDSEDPRFKPIRVEAIPVEYVIENGVNVDEVKMQYIHTTSTEIFIRIIDEMLLFSVEDGVLNLNNACLNNPEKFSRYFKVFFDFPVTYENFQVYENKRFYNIDYVCRRLWPQSEKYVVATSDDQMIEVPALPFQLYCNGFDAARLRSSSASHLELPVPTSAKAVKHLAEALLDIPSLFSVDMKTKEEIFQLADAMLITHLKPHLIQMIVMTAQQEDFKFINDLFGVYPEEMIENVAKHRPDIIFHWKNLPFNTSNLNILSEIANLIHQNFFVEQDTPITMAEDRHVDYERIDEKWLISMLSDNAQDKDVKGALMNSIKLWDGFEDSRTRKRKHSESGSEEDSEVDQ